MLGPGERLKQWEQEAASQRIINGIPSPSLRKDVTAAMQEQAELEREQVDERSKGDENEVIEEYESDRTLSEDDEEEDEEDEPCRPTPPNLPFGSRFQNSQWRRIRY